MIWLCVILYVLGAIQSLAFINALIRHGETGGGPFAVLFVLGWPVGMLLALLLKLRRAS